MIDKMDAMATQLATISGVPVNSAAISGVPVNSAKVTEDPTEMILNAIKEQTKILKIEVQRGNGGEN
jgi:hypothetical protein